MNLFSKNIFLKIYKKLRFFLIGKIFSKITSLRPFHEKDIKYVKWISEKIYENYYIPNLKKKHPTSFFVYQTFNDYWKDFWKILSNKDFRNILKNCLEMSNLMIPAHQSRENLYSYYKSLENIFIFRYLQYPLIDKKYLNNNIYPLLDFIKTFDCKVKYLEIGPGIPHKLFYLAYKYPEYVEKIETIEFFDLDIKYFEIVSIITKQIFPTTEVIINHSDFTSIIKPREKFNYFYAKDVFEHIFDAKYNLKSILEKSCNNARLVIDIIDREQEKYQHVTLNLSNLSEVILEKKFKEISIRNISRHLFKSRLRIFEK